jgi:hypothetical protein
MTATAPSYQTEPQIQFLYQLVRDIGEGHLQLPRFLRPFLWTEEQRLELFRSIRSGTPIGSVMVWRTNIIDIRCYDSLGPYELKPPSGELRTYVIDGHQRLETLFSALHTPPTGAPLLDEVAYFDAENDDFLFAQRDRTPEPTWLPLRFVLDFARLLPLQRSLTARPDADILVRRMDSVVGAFSRYKIPVLPIVANDLDQVTTMFQRLNSKGTVLSEVQMVNALTWSDTFDLNESIAFWKERWLVPYGWGRLDDKVILDACKVALGFDAYDSDVDAVSRALRQQPQRLDDAADAVLGAAKFLRGHCGIRSPELLPYASHIIPLAEAIRQKPEREDGADRDALVRWFWLLAYSGSRAGIPKLLQALAYFCGTSAELPAIPIALASPLPPLPKRFDFRTARCKTLALRLAERVPDGAELLSHARADALAHMVLDWTALSREWFPSPANRIFVDPTAAAQARSAIEEACKAGSMRRPEQQSVLEAHVISPEAADAFARNDLDAFFTLRRQALDALEADFARRMGILAMPIL